MNTNQQKHLHNTAPAILLVLGLLMVLTLGVLSNQKNDQRIILETRITAEQVKIRLESCIDSRAQLVQVLATHSWETRQQILNAWTEHASTLLPLYSGVLALNYVDSDWVIRVVYPVETNQLALNANLHEHPYVSVIRALTEAEKSSQLTRTDTIELLQSGEGFALYKQIVSSDGQPLGFVNGVFRIQDLIDSCLSEKPLRNRFVFALFEDDTPLYQQPESQALGQSPYLVDLPIDVAGRPWKLNFAPVQTYLDATNSLVNEVSIGLGVLLTFLLAFATRSLLRQQYSLTDNEDKYRLLVENQTDMVVKVNPKGEFQYVSPSYCKIFGTSEAELLGKQFLPRVHEDDREHTQKSIESLNYPPHTSYHEQRAMTKGGWRWMAWSNTAVLDANGTIEAITAVGRDITETKRLEENIAHSQKMKAIGELAGGITHDFNNLLQVIIGNIECLLLDNTQSEETRETLEQVCQVVERAMSLTQKLSTLSRQEITHREVFDTNVLLQELVVLLEHTLPASIKLSLALSEEPLPILADKALIEQVLLNICFNARDAIVSIGNIRIQTSKKELNKNFLRQIPDVEPGEYCLINIVDDGCGIDPEIISRIFDPFFTTKASGTGTGLGLANSYSIIKQHKGMILVDSTPESGSSFSVYIPLSKADVETQKDEPLLTSKPAITRSKLILVADDDAEILKLTQAGLKSVGYRTLGAADGKEALDLFTRHRQEIGMVVLDLVMPKMGGQEAAEAIRRVDKEVKILFVTGYIPDTVTASLNEPIIRKPYKRSLFLKTIEEILTK